MVAMVMRRCHKLVNKQLLGQCQMELSTETIKAVYCHIGYNY